MPRPPKSAEAKKAPAKKVEKAKAGEAARVNTSDKPRDLPSKPKQAPAAAKVAPKPSNVQKTSATAAPATATPSNDKKRKAEQSVEPKKAPRLEASSSPSAKAHAATAAKKQTSDSVKKTATKKPSGLDSIVLTKEQKKATPLSSLPVIPPVDEAKTMGLPGHPYVDVNQVLKGAKALSSHAKKVAHEAGKKSLFEAEDTIYLIVTLNKIPEKRKVRPTRIPLPNSLYGDDCEICILVKDPQKEFKEKFASKELPNVKKVLGVSKLRDNYGQFENRRQLLRSYDLFLCDDRVTLLMPGLLGKPFMKSKRMPVAIPVKDKDDIGSQIVKARDSTYLHLPTGTTCNIRIAMTTHSVKQIVENVMASVDKIAGSFNLGWANIRAMSLKTSESVALPVYNKLPALSQLKKKKEPEASAEAPVAAPKKAETPAAEKPKPEKPKTPASKPESTKKAPLQKEKAKGKKKD